VKILVTGATGFTGGHHHNAEPDIASIYPAGGAKAAVSSKPQGAPSLRRPLKKPVKS